ncbi:MAG: ankyrin repeat domain-containing protein, partial [Streptomyces sp.]|nr:ankyrin repeat domain-containing protein [Streptomyces sp.]
MRYLNTEDPLAAAVTEAIQRGDAGEVRRLLHEHPGLATVRLGDEHGTSRTLLHVLTDWPGHRPGGPGTVRELVAAGAEVDARFAGPHAETPLMWAASCDDVPVLDALLDAGADIEATGAVIGDGTALSDACAFAQWNAARRLVERGASARLWEAAALGLMDRVAAAFAAGP